MLPSLYHQFMQLVSNKGFNTPELCLRYVDLTLPVNTKNTLKHCTLFNHPENTSVLVAENRAGLEEGLNLLANLFETRTQEEVDNPEIIILFSKIMIGGKVFNELSEELLDLFIITGVATLY